MGLQSKALFLTLMSGTSTVSTSTAVSMLAAEQNGLALDFTDSFFFSRYGLYGSASVKDLTTIANNYNSIPGDLLTYTGTTKLTLQSDGVYRYGPHNLYVNSAAPANQSITVVSGASYSVTITGSVSVTASGAATGTWTAGTTTFTAATATLTLGSTSGSGTVHVRRTPSDSTYLATGASAKYGLPFEWNTSGVLQGIRIEPQATNLFLNSRAPATQTITVTNGAAYTVSFVGTGSITFSGANSSTLDGTGATDRVRATFTTSSTSLTCTVSGTIDLVQVQTGSVATDPIETYGAQVTQAADNITLSPSLFPYTASAITVIAEWLHDCNSFYAGCVMAINAGSNAHTITLETGSSSTSRPSGYAANASVSSFNSSVSGQPAFVRNKIYRGAVAIDGTSANVVGDAKAGTPDVTIVMPSAATRLVLGSYGAMQYLNGYIRKCVILPRRMTDAEMIVKTNSLTLVTEGDSITEQGGAATYPILARDAASYGVRVTNNAVSGSQIATLVSRAAALDALLVAGVRNVLTVLIGHNDIEVAGHSAATVYSDLSAYCTARRSAGWYVVVATLLPSTVSGFNTTRATLNASIRSGYSSFADKLWDVGADATMGPDEAASDLSLYSDGTHATATGRGYLATSLGVVIAGLVS